MPHPCLHGSRPVLLPRWPKSTAACASILGGVIVAVLHTAVCILHIKDTKCASKKSIFLGESKIGVFACFVQNQQLLSWLLYGYTLRFPDGPYEYNALKFCRTFSENR
jgi:hypothetical protein